MIIIKVTPEIITDLLTEGKIIERHIIKKGLPPNCILRKSQIKDDLVEFWFTEVEDCKQQEIIIERI